MPLTVTFDTNALHDLAQPEGSQRGLAARRKSDSMNQLVPIAPHVPDLVVAAGDRAQTRFWELFVSDIRNPNTRRG